MNSVNVFLNNRIVIKNAFYISDIPIALGDWFLTPVRCLFDGNKVIFSVNNKDSITVDHEKEYYGWNKPERNFLRVVASIIFIIPGIIIGSAFKGIGYLWEFNRVCHRLVIRHYTSVDHTIGAPENRLNLEAIKQQLSDLRQNNQLNQPTKNLIVYAEEGTAINEDPGIIGFDPQKTILVGARIVHQPSRVGRLDEALIRYGWEERGCVRKVSNTHEIDNSTYVIQWKKKSVQAALDDVPARKSIFSTERYKRVYIV